MENKKVLDYLAAHEFSSNHKTKLEKDKVCGCFYCQNVFNPKQIKEWVQEDEGTAICPYCGIDSVIGENSGYPITVEFLKGMHDYWF